MFEYLLIIPPSDDVYADAFLMKRFFKRNYGLDAPLISKPHFTVCNFLHFPKYEDRLLSKFSHVAHYASCFTLELANFGHYFNPKHNTYTLHSPVDHCSEYNLMLKQLKDHCRPLMANLKDRPSYTNNAHLTIAKNLSEEQFTFIWPSWKDKKYNALSYANSLRLLRREYDVDKAYETIGEFQFGGLGFPKYQLELFS